MLSLTAPHSAPLPAQTAVGSRSLRLTADAPRVAAFGRQLRRRVGPLAADVLDLRLRGLTAWQMLRRRSKLTRWRLRRLIRAIRMESWVYAGITGDLTFPASVERLLRRRT